MALIIFESSVERFRNSNNSKGLPCNMIHAVSRVLALVAVAQAYPQAQIIGVLSTNASTISNKSYTLPAFDPNPAARAAELEQNRAGYLYGPSKIGNSSFFLSGPLGDQVWQGEVALWEQDAAPVRAAVRAEATPALQSVIAVSM